MEASKVTIAPTTWSQQKLTPKRRRELKRENVLAYLRSRPYGKRVIAKELMQFGFTTASGAHVYLKALERDGLITKHELGLRSAFYTVNEPVKTSGSHGLDEGQVAAIKIMNDVIDKAGTQVSLEEQAMRFAWEHPLYNNDLREFIKWTNKEGK